MPTPSLDIQGNTIHLKHNGSTTVRFAQLPGDGPYAFQAKIRSSGTAGVTVAPGNQAVVITTTPAEQEFRQVFPAVLVADNPYLTLTFPPGEFWISEIQLEQGNVITGWKLSTEDVIDNVQQILDAARTTQAAYTRVSTAGATAKKVPDYTIPDFTLAVGIRVACLMLYANTVDNPTLNVNGTGEYAIVTSDGTVLTAANSSRIGWANNSLVTFIWDGRFWRIDDSASLIKIDNILTENIVGTHGWINLGGGVFNFDNKLVWNGTTLTITGDLVSSKMTGTGIDITGEGDIVVTDGTYTAANKYRVGIATDDQTTHADPSDADSASLQLKRISLFATANKNNTNVKNAFIDMDPYEGIHMLAPYFMFYAPGGAAIAEYAHNEDTVFINKPLWTGAINADGSISADGNISTEGRFYEQGERLNPQITWPITNDALNGDKSLSSGTTTQSIDSFELEAGAYLIILCTEFSSNSTGRRYVCISDSNTGGAINNTLRAYAAAVNGGITSTRIVALMRPSADTTYYIRGYQNSGSSLTVSNRLTAIKLN